MKRPLYNAIHSLLYDRRHFFAALCVRFSYLFSDVTYLKLMFFLELRKSLDLKDPKTYNEKLQWLKLYYRRPLLSTMADKVAVKEYVANRIGNEYVVPLLGVWNDVKDIEWDNLPMRFVLKTNHDGGNYGVILCKDKSMINRRKVEKRLQKSLQRDTFLLGREWPYKDIPHKVFAEQYIEDASRNDLEDYKFFCFDGKVRLLYIATERQSESGVKIDYYDEFFNHLDLKQSHPNAIVPPPKPFHFELMKSLAEILSEGIPHVRVDFFEANGKVYFSEFTFFTFGGWAAFHPEEYDYKLGSYLKLPSERYV
jgi:hypothetical protein